MAAGRRIGSGLAGSRGQATATELNGHSGAAPILLPHHVPSGIGQSLLMSAVDFKEFGKRCFMHTVIAEIDWLSS
jgi:hypothetical protein